MHKAQGHLHYIRNHWLHFESHRRFADQKLWGTVSLNFEGCRWDMKLKLSTICWNWIVTSIDNFLFCILHLDHSIFDKNYWCKFQLYIMPRSFFRYNDRWLRYMTIICILKADTRWSNFSSIYWDSKLNKGWSLSVIMGSPQIMHSF